MGAHACEIRATVFVCRCFHRLSEHAQRGLVQSATRRSALRWTGFFRFGFDGYGGRGGGLSNELLFCNRGSQRRLGCRAIEHIDIYELVAGRYERSRRLAFTEPVNGYARSRIRDASLAKSLSLETIQKPEKRPV